MAVQQVNLYAFTIQLNSKHKANYHVGDRVLAVGASAAAALAVLQQQFGNDIATVSSGTMISSGIYTTLA